MPQSTLSRLWVLLAILGLVILIGCSDSDTTSPDSIDPVPVDTAAPLVRDINPGDKANAVAVDRDISITFTEPVDQATLAAALTINSGDITGTVWNDAGTEVVVSHTAWAEGVPVTVTVGAAVTDLAGNAMPQAFGSTFYTASTAPVMIDYDFFSDLGSVPPDGYFIIQFSHEMDLSSIFNAVTLTEDPVGKAVPGIRVGTEGGDLSRVKIIWDGELTPLHTYHFSLGTAALTRAGTPLSEGFTIDFTAGTEVDETPPYILDTVPALDSVVETDLKTVTITFSERIDPGYRIPDARSALLDVFMAREPVWNDAGDEITLYLSGPLPEGIRFYAIWDESNLRDMAGNFSTQMDSLSFSTGGEASLFPVREDLRIYYHHSGGKNIPQMARQTFENIAGNDFERVMHELTELGFTQEIDRWYMRKDGLNRLLRGFQDGSYAVMFNPAVNYLPQPVPDNWSGSATISAGGQTVDLAFTGTYLETTREHFISDKGYHMGYLDNVVYVEFYHSLTLPGAETPFEDGYDWIQFCPGLGIYSLGSEGAEYEDGVEIDSWEDSFYFEAAAPDDRFDTGMF